MHRVLVPFLLVLGTLAFAASASDEHQYNPCNPCAARAEEPAEAAVNPCNPCAARQADKRAAEQQMPDPEADAEKARRRLEDIND